MGYRGSLSNNASMIRYHDLEVKLYGLSSSSWNSLYTYTDPLKGTGKVIPMTVNNIVYSSDATPTVLTGTVQDFELSKRNIVMSEKGHSSRVEDSNSFVPGAGITVELKTDSSTSKIIFKGYIGSITRNFSQNGVSYTVEARDVKSRLTYQTIKKVYNGNYKNGLLPAYLDETNLYTDERLTVSQILRDILYYSKKSYSNGGRYDFTGFEYSDFDFQNDSYLMEFVPPTLSFDNITILEAIYRLINSAGCYRIVYDYETNKFYFPRLDEKCRKCGEEIQLHYGGEGESFDDVNVVSDNTHRKIYDVVNVIKAYTAPIEWYSGHFHIERGEYPQYSGTGFPTVVSNSGYKKLYFSCRNWDGYPYYFGINSVPIGNSSGTIPYVVVGAPLYPAWYPGSGYGPFQRHYDTYFEDISGNTHGPKCDLVLNYGVTENDVRFIKDRNFLDTVSRDRLQNAIGMSYIAYVPYGVCPACNGSGAVASGWSSRPDLFGQTRDFNGNPINQSFLSGLSPFNYGFTASTNKDGIDRFTGGLNEPTTHPVPWRNMCPVCRGTGVEPWFRMGTILTSLIDVSPEQTKLGDLYYQELSNSVPLDKTYSQAATDMSYKYSPVVHVETAVDYYKAYEYKDSLSSAELIEHPLNGYCQISAQSANIPGGLNTSARVIPNGSDGTNRPYKKREHYIHALRYTQVVEADGFSIDQDRSMVIFNNSQFIPCSAPMANPSEGFFKDGARYAAYDQSSGCFKYNFKGENDGVGQYVGSFWRPSRAWITCYFKMDRLEENLGYNYGFSRTVSGTGGYTDSYEAAARIEDGRYCVEIFKTSGDNSTNEYRVRPISAGISFDDLKWQVHPWDYYKRKFPTSNITVPNTHGNIWSKNYRRSMNAGYSFPCGKIMKHEPLRDSEIMAAANSGASADDVLKGDIFGKVISWCHQDDREKLFEKACEELERRNNIQVSGTITIKGDVPDFTGGFGWVYLPNANTPVNTRRIKACVVKMTLNFGTDFTMDLEVGTEELRVGMKKERDMDYDRLISDTISRLNLGTSGGSNNYRGSGSPSSVTNQNRGGGGNSGGSITYGCIQFRR